MNHLPKGRVPLATLTPLLPWSVLEFLIFKEIADGLWALSIVKSPMDKCVLGSYDVPTVVSPDLQNEKKVTVETAHSIKELGEGSGCSHTTFNFQRIASSIGKRLQGAFPFFPASTLTPFKTW